ncbi:hypothetical protein ACI8AA_12155 [Geodermatophilus sp. SYSU D01180]
MIGDLLENRMDLAVGWAAPPAGVESIESTQFAAVTLHGVVRADDELATGEQLARRDLVGRRLVMYSPSRETRPFYVFSLSCFADSRGRLPEVTHVPVLDDARQAMLDAVERLGGLTLSVAGEPPAIEGLHLATRPFEPPIVARVVAMWRGRSMPVLLPALSRFTQAAEEPPTPRGERMTLGTTSSRWASRSEPSGRLLSLQVTGRSPRPFRVAR